ncbi:MAG: PEGA domain-containing protein [Archangium sp.]|nr:PEGA domain-containing protein [Archangium sp.]
MRSAVLGLVMLLVGLWAGPAAAQTTVWLVRPLYPGQEALVDRTQKALDKLIPPELRKDAVIGTRELAALLKGRKLDEVPCFSGDERCTDPIDAFVASFGFERVVLIQGGQDEAGVKFRVVSYEPKSGKVAPATSTNAVLEKALLGAIAKVVPVASTLDVKSNPPGASVYVDDVKVGVTPLTTQVLPGERVVRLDLKLHQPIEETVIIPIRGTATLDKTLEKVAARIVITASPAGTVIEIDGQPQGKDKVDRGISPGTHTIRLTAENHKAYEQQITVKADEQFVLDKTLEPVPEAVIPSEAKVAIVTRDGTKEFVKIVTGPVTPPTETELTYEKKAFIQLGFEVGSILGDSLVGRRWGNNGTGRTASFTTPSRLLMGVGADYGTFGKYFGLTVVGVSYLTNVERMGFNVGFAPGQNDLEHVGDVYGASTAEPVRVNLVTIRVIQPQFRICFWKFMVSVQLGVEFRTGQISVPAEANYKDGFMPLDLFAAGRLNVRYFAYEGFYIHASGQFAYLLPIQEARLLNDDRAYRSSNQLNVNVGVGYGF